MTEIERKALALVNEVAQDVRYEPDDFEEERRDVFKALVRALERHEAYKQEVSDAVEGYNDLWRRRTPGRDEFMGHFIRFTIAKPDPLVDAWRMAFPGNHIEDARDKCAKISAAIEARGGKIVWGDK